MKDLYIQVKQGGTPPETGLYGIGRPVAASGAPVSYHFNRLYRLLDVVPDRIGQGDGFIVYIKNGEMFSLGLNANGQTGQGTTTGTTIKPTKIGTDSDWSMVSCGQAHVMAIKTNGTVWSWGNNANGRTGLGTTAGNTLVPTQIGSDTDWTHVNCGAINSVAIKGGKTLTCGNNGNGRLGQGLAPSAGTNIDVFTELDGGSTGWTDAEYGQLHLLAIKSGNIWGAGSSSGGRLGDGVTSATNNPTIFQINTAGNWTSVNCGNLTSMAINSSGELFGTGSQDEGALGNGGSGNLSTFTQIGTDTDWQRIALTVTTVPDLQNSAIAQKGNRVWVTGSNRQNQLGIDSSSNFVSTWTKLSDIPVTRLSQQTWSHTLAIVS
jgi:alpha-tubulin suppressor-like RCC1 family protein